MTLMRDNHVDIGVLVAWALRPNQRPGRSPEYQRVLDRYRTVAEFRAAATPSCTASGHRSCPMATSASFSGSCPSRPWRSALRTCRACTRATTRPLPVSS